jgi:hypothetical protein
MPILHICHWYVHRICSLPCLLHDTGVVTTYTACFTHTFIRLCIDLSIHEPSDVRLVNKPVHKWSIYSFSFNHTMMLGLDMHENLVSCCGRSALIKCQSIIFLQSYNVISTIYNMKISVHMFQKCDVLPSYMYVNKVKDPIVWLNLIQSHILKACIGIGGMCDASRVWFAMSYACNLCIDTISIM